MNAHFLSPTDSLVTIPWQTRDHIYNLHASVLLAISSMYFSFISIFLQGPFKYHFLWEASLTLVWPLAGCYHSHFYPDSIELLLSSESLWHFALYNSYLYVLCLSSTNDDSDSSYHLLRPFFFPASGKNTLYLTITLWVKYYPTSANEDMEAKRA